MDNFILAEFNKAVFVEKQIVDRYLQLEFTRQPKSTNSFMYLVLFSSALVPTGMGKTVMEKYQKPLISLLILLIFAFISKYNFGKVGF